MMKSNSKTNFSTPPRFAVRLLEMVLSPDVAENEIGDLEEEYRDKVRREGHKRARKWFWIQVLSTLRISIKEEGIRRVLIERAMRGHWRQERGFLTLSNGDQVIRQSWIIPISVFLTFFCLLALYLLLHQTSKIELQAMQIPGGSYQSESITNLGHSNVINDVKAPGDNARKFTIKTIQINERQPLATINVQNDPIAIPADEIDLGDVVISKPFQVVEVAVKADPSEFLQHTNIIEGSPDIGRGGLIAEGPKPTSQEERTKGSASTTLSTGNCWH